MKVILQYMPLVVFDDKVYTSRYTCLCYSENSNDILRIYLHWFPHFKNMFYRLGTCTAILKHYVFFELNAPYKIHLCVWTMNT